MDCRNSDSVSGYGINGIMSCGQYFKATFSKNRTIGAPLIASIYLQPRIITTLLENYAFIDGILSGRQVDRDYATAV